MTEFVIDWSDHHYRIHVDRHELVIDRLDEDGPTPMGRLTIEATEVLGHFRIDTGP